MRLSTLALALAAASWIPGNVASAAVGYFVQQTVLYTGGAKSEAILNWRVTDKQFRVDVTRGNDTRNFVFNGRTFYVCGKLSANQLGVLKKLALDDKKLLDSLSAGACQELSTDFTARFFMAPYEAIGDLDLAGGYGSSLEIGESQVELTGKADTVQNTKCVEMKRSLVLKNKDNAKAEKKIGETACATPQIKWRQTMSREIGMALIRQPGGQKSFQAMNVDLKKFPGMPLKMSGQTTGTTSDGKAINRNYDVSTSRSGVGEVSESDAAMPKGFEIIDPKNLEALVAKSKVPAGKGGKSSAAEDVLRALIIGAAL